MLMSRRITLEEVQSAYLQTHYKPIIGAWLNSDRDACCGMSALCIAKGHRWVINNLIEAPTDTIIKDMSDVLSLSFDYTNGFIIGWDILSLSRESRLQLQASCRQDLLNNTGPLDFLAGYDDGITIGAAILGD